MTKTVASKFDPGYYSLPVTERAKYKFRVEVWSDEYGFDVIEGVSHYKTMQQALNRCSDFVGDLKNAACFDKGDHVEVRSAVGKARVLR